MTKKPISGAERTRNSVRRYKDAGLIHGKVWMHPDEAARIRKYAAKQPLTKIIIENLKN